MQRQRIRLKMSSICLEPSADLSISSSASEAGVTTSVAIMSGKEKYQATAVVQNNQQQSTHTTPRITLPFPDPARARVGALSLTQIIDDEDVSPDILRRKKSPQQTPPGYSNQTNTQRRSLSTVKWSTRRSKKRDCGEAEHLGIGNIYDDQLEKRAKKSSKRQKISSSVLTTRGERREREEGGSEMSENVDSSLLLSPVKRRLYQKEDDDGEETLLTPVKMVEDDDKMTSDDNDDDPFTTIGHFLRLIEDQQQIR